MRVSIRAYAKHHNVSGAVVRGVIKAGCTPSEAGGTLDVDKVGEQWHESANSAQ